MGRLISASVLVSLAVVSLCAAATITVNADGTGDYPTIQAAIDDANDGDVIIVADGVYTGPGNRDIDFFGKAITVISESGPENCIIDCGGTKAEPHRGFYFHSGEGPNSVVAGLTVTNGLAPSIRWGGFLWSVGGAIFCDSSSPTISHCNITGNAAELFGGRPEYGGLGGGIFCFKSSNPTIRNCAISNNFAGGGYYNFGTGGGISCDGITWGSSSSPTIIYCTIANNSAASEGGGILLGKSAIVTNCSIYGNSAAQGAGIFSDYHCHPTIRHCTIAGNLGDGIYTKYSNATISHCIVWDNIGPEILVKGSGAYVPLVCYSDVQGGYTGEGNTDADPCFINPTANNYHLSSASACIDAGDPEFVPQQSEVDIDGEPRVMGNRVDMGVDEFDFFEMPFITISHIAFGFGANKGGPNPEEKILSIRNSGMGTLNWEIVEDCNWLAVEPNNGSSTGEPNDVILSVDVTGLEKGTYYCNFAIVDPCAWNDPQTVLVTLYVSVPFIELSSNEFEFFSYAIGGPNPDPQMLTIRNIGGGTLNWQISYDCNWLAVAPNAGSCLSGQVNDVTLSVDITGLAEGIYDCNLTISDPNASNSPQIAQVELFISESCFPDTPDYARQYADYLLYKQYNNNPLRVDCWCAPPEGSGYQCDGDADGFIHGYGKYRVYLPDLTLVVNNWKKKIDDPTIDPCADFDHKPSGYQKYRVYLPDLTILVNSWKMYDVDNFTRPVEERLPGDCPRPE